MFKLVFLCIVIALLITFFGSTIVSFIQFAGNGFSALFSAITIPLDFIRRVTNSMLHFQYINFVFSIFVCVHLIFLFVKLLRGVDLSLPKDTEDSYDFED